MNPVTLHLEGLAFWADGLPDWASACTHARTGALPDAPPRKPAPDLLAPNERRRAPDTVALAMDVAHRACLAAGRDPAHLPSVFTSTHGDLAITDYMCRTLADSPTEVSPTKFHNSVHNAAAGYWTIGVGCMAPATAISAYAASFAQGLLEAAAQVAADGAPVLLVAYDIAATGPLATVSRSEGLLAAAFVLGPDAPDAGGPRLALALEPGDAAAGDGPLALRYAGNAMSPMLPLLDALASTGDDCRLHAGPGLALRVEVRR